MTAEAWTIIGVGAVLWHMLYWIKERVDVLIEVTRGSTIELTRMREKYVDGDPRDDEDYIDLPVTLPRR